MEIENVTPAADKAVRKYLAEAGARWTIGGGITAFKMFTRDGSPNKNQYSYITDYPDGQAPCHNAVQCCEHEGIVVNAMKSSVSSQHRDFLLWVAQGSPYSHGVLNRDNEEEILNNGMVIDMSIVGKGGALWLCKAVRNCTEHPHVPTVFKKLLDAGVDPLWAYVGGAILTREGSPQTSSYHGANFHYQTPEALFAFVEELKKGEKNTTSNCALPPLPYDRVKGYARAETWGALGYKTVRVPDGWGGYEERKETTDPSEYADLLKRIAKEGTLNDAKA